RRRVEAGPAAAERAPAPRLQPSARARATRRTSRGPAGLSPLWPALAGAERHRGLRADRDRGPGLPPSDTPSPLSSDLPLRGLPDAHGAAATQVDPQESAGHFGVAGDPAGQVRQPSADGTAAGRLETPGPADRGEYRGRRLATVGAAVF